MADGFVFFSSYYESISCLKTNKAKLLLFESICKYALYGEEPEQLPPEIKGKFVLMKPNIDSSVRRRNASVSNGSKGGAPKGNQNARKQPKNNPTEQPNNNLNKDMDLDMDLDMEKDVDRECDMDSENTTHAHGKFSNVFLTDVELEQLQAEFFNWQALIDKLSEYMASTGKTYNSHYATLCKWAREDGEKAQKQPNRQYGKQLKADELSEFYNMTANWANSDS